MTWMDSTSSSGVSEDGAPASAGAALLQDVDRLGDAALPCLVGLGALDLKHMPGLVAVGQAVEGAPGGSVAFLVTAPER